MPKGERGKNPKGKEVRKRQREEEDDEDLPARKTRSKSRSKFEEDIAQEQEIEEDESSSSSEYEPDEDEEDEEEYEEEDEEEYEEAGSSKAKTGAGRRGSKKGDKPKVPGDKIPENMKRYTPDPENWTAQIPGDHCEYLQNISKLSSNFLTLLSKPKTECGPIFLVSRLAIIVSRFMWPNKRNFFGYLKFNQCPRLASVIVSRFSVCPVRQYGVPFNVARFIMFTPRPMKGTAISGPTILVARS